ncbi:hydroxymethylglutaryl-CoA synthase [Helcococcus ovis]|uniref:Hydroxymethylglutaryl-CoA synthase n=2 Tax=Helcococcus ovis TaxID=72026 RepID=A0A4R9C674_9FIRM|nr:hydroxymethylglutaryl-CoA synthase [Helcococcus ovis]TFF65371.1 hydroxymethylglutaryl-CoA synthase [Helcococcus ovis]TFF67672.1 hydroxymethylglutaryl-CoA synthase [Helcococcus ovis]
MQDKYVGIEKISLYIPKYYVNIEKLARQRNVDPDKWTKGIGQEKMSIIPKNQDIVSMAANAAINILNDEDKKNIGQVIFATESGFDFSKSASTYLFDLLNINKFAKTYEIKQACYSATAAIQIACDYVRLRPNQKVLIVSSDIAKYGPKTGGEVTQGAGAIAILISSSPKILRFTDKFVSLTRNEYDFWRPSYSEYPIVDGKFSTQLYIDMFKESVNEFKNRYKNTLQNIDTMLFHLPFSKMGKKALISLEEDLPLLSQKWLSKYDQSTKLCRQIGNLYTGSLYLSFLSQLIYGNLKENSEIGFFSYGSGAVCELFTGILLKDFTSNIDIKFIEKMLENRDEIDVSEYDLNYFEKIYTEENFIHVEEKLMEKGFNLKGIENGKREYVLLNN